MLYYEKQNHQVIFLFKLQKVDGQVQNVESQVPVTGTNLEPWKLYIYYYHLNLIEVVAY